MAVFSVVWGVSGLRRSALWRHRRRDARLSLALGFLIFAAAAVAFAAACVPSCCGSEPECRQREAGARQFSCSCAHLAWRSASRRSPPPGLEQRAPIVPSGAGPRRACLGILSFLRAGCAAAGRRACFQSAPSTLEAVVGSGLLMVAALSVSTCSFWFLRAAAAGFAARFLAGHHRPAHRQRVCLLVHAVDPLWPRAPQAREALIVRAGALMIAGGRCRICLGRAIRVDGRACSSSPLLQGGGFGILWPFANRRVVEAALPA